MKKRWCESPRTSRKTTNLPQQLKLTDKNIEITVLCWKGKKKVCQHRLESALADIYFSLSFLFFLSLSLTPHRPVTYSHPCSLHLAQLAPRLTSLWWSWWVVPDIPRAVPLPSSSRSCRRKTWPPGATLLAGVGVYLWGGGHGTCSKVLWGCWAIHGFSQSHLI